MKASVLDRRATNQECWDECEAVLLRRFREAMSESMQLEGRATEIVIRVPVHGFKPGQPILGVMRK